MPLYDFRCPTCGRTYEVLRPVSRLEEPLLCMDDRTPCERALSAPNFVTKSSAELEAAAEPTAPPAGGTWSHFGHSHATGSRGHAHEAEQATPES
jgi:putative FmdB family regulatory protein